MGSLKLNNYTTVSFKDRKPICVSWQLYHLSECPSDKELCEEVKSKLESCGWKVQLSNFAFESEDEGYSDYGATITLII